MSQVQLLGVPTDYGANRRGVDMGPSAIRYAGIKKTLKEAGIACSDDGDLGISHPHPSSDQPPVDDKLKFFDQIRDVNIALADRVATIKENGNRPIALGGDHSLAIGSLAGTTRNDTLGVLWIDAHGDFNTPETTPSGNVHGMALAAALDKGMFADIPWTTAQHLHPENIALVGTRSLDQGERELLNESPVSVFTISEIDKRGIHAVMEDAIDIVTEGTEGIHLSLDLDVLDPNIAPGVGTPERGGLSYREAHVAMEIIADNQLPQSMDIVEVNPILDQKNATAELACELTASVFDKSIL
ncbi:arginase [Salinarchaeum sp. IM2453]|uniref:arginase n=1 Tax=Salinarchaeum sp. IM2453 TaxID=2862870 RepID=UPI001C833C13|nr:arginase [Salinarchaeum sp. IM2453]QZA89206.1 arginase [Salinarchaeum sp. IM2453]